MNFKMHSMPGLQHNDNRTFDVVLCVCVCLCGSCMLPARLPNYFLLRKYGKRCCDKMQGDIVAFYSLQQNEHILQNLK